jgi:hypothetical protein
MTGKFNKDVDRANERVKHRVGQALSHTRGTRRIVYVQPKSVGRRKAESRLLNEAFIAVEMAMNAPGQVCRETGRRQA